MQNTAKSGQRRRSDQRVAGGKEGGGQTERSQRHCRRHTVSTVLDQELMGMGVQQGTQEART